MKAYRAAAATMLLAGAVFLGSGVVGAQGYPLVAGAPHVALDRATPPNTNECVKETGLACYQPNQIERAYGVPTLWTHGVEGQGQTIVLVDSFGSPTIRHDLSVFDSAFHLPEPPSLRIIQPAGPVPPYEPTNEAMVSWAIETSLDVEYSHSIAPKANILLVETPVAETEGVEGFPQIIAAENYVIGHHLGDVISQSFGATEETFPNVQSLLSLRSAYYNAAANGVTVVSGSGDYGVSNEEPGEACCYPYRVNSWPSSDPLVTSVGGAQLHLNLAGERTAPDNVWDERLGEIVVGGGGGPSHVFPRPSYQYLVNTGSGFWRATPDISMSAAVNGGVLIFTSFEAASGFPAPNSFNIIGGTSEATPLFAGVVALADQVAGHPLGLINPSLYALERFPNGGIVDITKGQNSFELFEKGVPTISVPGFEAGPGYDMASGLGTVWAPTLVPALAHFGYPFGYGQR